jgi:small subunit ribosomal protein S11
MSDEKKTEKVVADVKVAKKTPETAKAPAAAAKGSQKAYTRTAKGKKRIAKVVPRGIAYVRSSLNNTLVTVTDLNGNAIAWSSAGKCGFKGPKKATPYAAGVVIGDIAEKLEKFGTKELSVQIIGIGKGRDSAIRTLNAKGFSITSIKEATPMPHNGCRPRRARRM